VVVKEKSYGGFLPFDNFQENEDLQISTFEKEARKI